MDDKNYAPMVPKYIARVVALDQNNNDFNFYLKSRVPFFLVRTWLEVDLVEHLIPVTAGITQDESNNKYFGYQVLFNRAMTPWDVELEQMMLPAGEYKISSLDGAALGLLNDFLFTIQSEVEEDA